MLLMARVDLYMPTEMYMRVNGKTVWLMATEYIHIKMVENMKATGLMISRKDMVANYGLTAAVMMGISEEV
jgi:hypothetical protein